MTTPTTEQSEGPPLSDGTGTVAPPPGRPWYHSLKRVLSIAGLGVVAASYGVWVYVYSGAADRPTPDLLDHPAVSVEAEAVCSAALDDLAQGPQAFDATNGAERADQIRTSTARLETMVVDLQAIVDRLEAAVGSDARDVEILNEWLDDWRVLNGDRYRYADAVAQDPAARYLMTDTGVGERLDRRITRLATTNRMTSCGTPQDVG